MNYFDEQKLISLSLYSSAKSFGKEFSMQACLLQNVQWENYRRVSNSTELVYSRTILPPNNTYTMLWRVLVAVECKESENTSRNLRDFNCI